MSFLWGSLSDAVICSTVSQCPFVISDTNDSTLSTVFSTIPCRCEEQDGGGEEGTGDGGKLEGVAKLPCHMRYRWPSSTPCTAHAVHTQRERERDMDNTHTDTHTRTRTRGHTAGQPAEQSAKGDAGMVEGEPRVTRHHRYGDGGER